MLNLHQATSRGNGAPPCTKWRRHRERYRECGQLRGLLAAHRRLGL